MSESERMPYRGDVDFLRGIAILLVVLFHFGFTSLAGGYVGVDVFFVISGYLIYGSSLANLRSAFDLMDFFKRRIARIGPALVLTIVATLICARFLISARELDRIYSAAPPSLLLSANFYFFFRTDYFHGAGLNPFLHLWSIAIEEQFYLTFPVFLLLFGNRRRTIFVLAIASFIATVLTNLPDANFYLLPFRLWELGAGALLVGARKPRTRGEAGAVALLGLALIVAGALFIASDAFSWLGVSIPCLGAACFIYGGEIANPVSSILARNPIQQLGRISYSLYLIHWPIWIFARYVLLRLPSHLESIGLFAVSIALSALFFRFIERPALSAIRQRPVKRVFAFAFASVLILIVAVKGLDLERERVALPALANSPLGKEADSFSATSYYVDNYSYGTCMLSEKQEPEKFPVQSCLPVGAAKHRIAVVGSSLAAHYVAGLKANAHEGDVIGQITAAGCDLFEKAEARCARFFDSVVPEALAKWRPDVVVVAGAWRLGAKASEIEARLEAFRERLGRPRFVVVGAVPVFALPVPRLVPDRYYRSDADLSAISARALADPTNAELRDWAKRANFPFFDVRRLFCQPDDECLVVKDGHFLTWDAGGHLTVEGSRLAGAELLRLLEP